jgi:ketosteroid isomerase-like protein
MTARTETRFDLDALARGLERLDVDAVLELYADDVEQIEMDDKTPPSSPRVRHGKETIGQMLRACAENGIVLRVDNLVPGDQRAAATISCEFPGGRKVVANSILELRDDKIARQIDVQARDA